MFYLIISPLRPGYWFLQQSKGEMMEKNPGDESGHSPHAIDYSPLTPSKKGDGMVHIDIDLGLETTLNVISFLLFMSSLSLVVLWLLGEMNFIYSIVLFVLFMVSLVVGSMVDQSYVVDKNAGVVLLRQRLFGIPSHKEVALMKNARFIAIYPRVNGGQERGDYWSFQIVLAFRDGGLLPLSEPVLYDPNELFPLLESLSVALTVPVREMSLEHEWEMSDAFDDSDTDIVFRDMAAVQQIWRNRTFFFLATLGLSLFLGLYFLISVI